MEITDKKIDMVVAEVKSLQEENKEMAKALVEATQKGLTAGEFKKEVNNKFAQAVTKASELTNKVEQVKALDGKTFIFNTKDAKLGANTYQEQVPTEYGVDKYEAYPQLTSFFGETPTRKDTVQSEFHQSRNQITVGGVPIPECAPASEGSYDYNNVKFAIEKYGLSLDTSVEFVEFVDGGIDNMLRVLITDLKNNFIKASLHGDDATLGRYGLFNETTTRVFENQIATTAGIISTDDLIDLQGSNKISVVNGSFVMPNASYLQLSKLKNAAGEYIFIACNGTMTVGTYNLMGTLLSKPVYVVSDDVWFKYTAGAFETLATNNVEMAFYGSKEAFEYYRGSTSKYEELLADVFAQGDVAIQLDKDPANVGCLKVTAFMFAGYGVTNPTVGSILRNVTTP